MIKPTLPKGTRDFRPDQVQKRNYILNTIKGVFEKYGYLPIETPAMENLSTLTGKYGVEGDKLLFRILNSGDYLKKVKDAGLDMEVEPRKMTPLIAEKGLRYDLTIPFARYVVQHQNEITFPFKRYQVQPVWRADRPQKGRYREFYQCDADIIGSKALINDLELIQLFIEVFQLLGLEITIKMNNRKILAGLSEVYDIADQFNDFTIALDKLDKVGIEGVRKELESRSINTEILQIAELAQKSSAEKILSLKEILKGSTLGMTGVEEIEKLYSYMSELGISTSCLEFDITLARGLDYYTGIILETVARDLDMGSIGGGGRYDDLTGIFGLKDVSGTGISFGIERIFDLMESESLFPEDMQVGTQVLFVNFGGESEITALRSAAALRKEAVSSEVYPSSDKIKKQVRYANAKHIPYVVFIGDEELKSGHLQIKEMESGNQEAITIAQLIEKLK